MADLIIPEQEEPDIRGLSRPSSEASAPQPLLSKSQLQPAQPRPVQTQEPRSSHERQSDGRAISHHHHHHHHRDTLDPTTPTTTTSTTSTTSSGNNTNHTTYPIQQVDQPEQPDRDFKDEHVFLPYDAVHGDHHLNHLNLNTGTLAQPPSNSNVGLLEPSREDVKARMNRDRFGSKNNQYHQHDQHDQHYTPQFHSSSFGLTKNEDDNEKINEKIGLTPSTGEKSEVVHLNPEIKMEVDGGTTAVDLPVDPLSPMPYHRFRSQSGNQNQRVTPTHPSPGAGAGGGGGLLGIGGILKPRSKATTPFSTSASGNGTNDMHARFGLLCEPRKRSPAHVLVQPGLIAIGGGPDGVHQPIGSSTPERLPGAPAVLENIGPIRPTKSIAELFTPGRKLGSEPGWKESGRNVLKSSYLVYLLPLVPVAWALHLSHQPPVIVFVFTFLAIIPLASLLSFATEQLALRMGDALGGLLNATFGNAVELLISILALVKGEIGLVQASMIGSILSNTLLVLGFCFFCGGLRFHEQIYSTSASQLQISLLGIAMCALVLPAAFQFSLSSLSTSTVIRPIEEITDLDSRTRSMLLSISRGTSFMLLSTYAVYLVFQLYTHAYLFKRRPQAIKRPHHEPGAPRPNHAKVLPISEWVAAVRSRGSASSSSDGLTPTTTRDTMHMASMTEGATSTAVDLELGGGGAGSIRDTRSVLEFAQDDEEEEEEIPLVKAFFALGLLLVVTGITGVTAEFLVDSIDGVTESTSISREFVGLVLLPIVGNIPETVCAITVSVKDKLDLALSIAVGSTIQVALGLLPLLVLVGWAIGQPMSLFFDTFQIISLAVSLIIVAFAISDGRSCFAEGYILIMTYLIFALCSWYYDPSLVT